MRGARGFLIPAGISATIFLGACHKDMESSGAVPIDTAAVMPMLDTTPAPDSTPLPDSGADSTAIDSLSATSPPDVPSTIAVADSIAGDRLFHGKGRCFTCHGERGQGTPRLGPSLTDSEWLTGNGSLASIEYVTTHGVAVPKATPVAMPAYSAMLSTREIALTAAYVYALAHPGSTLADSGARDTTGRSPAPGPVR